MPKEQYNRENTQLARLKKNIKTILTGSGHSPAGKKYLAAVKKKKATQIGLGRQSKRMLKNLSDADYKAVMKALGKK